MKELITNNSKFKEICSKDIHSFVYDSIIQGNTQGKIFVDDFENMSLFMIYEGNCVYFGGEAEDESKYKEAINFFKESYLSKRKELDIVKINYYPEVWENYLLEGLKGFKRKVADRSLFKHDLENVKVLNKNNQDLSIIKIDDCLLKNNSLGNINCVIDEIEGMWGSVERFISDGFGYCAIKNGDIISWCTAEYVSKNYCGIGIETIENYEGKGVATIVSNEFLKNCETLNITPYWDSWKENIPSVRVAEKNGFKKICDYRVVLIKLN